MADKKYTPEVLTDAMEYIENLGVVAHSTDCGKALMMIVDDKGVI